MKILYLCNKKHVDMKMSRVRFHGIEALGKLVYVKWWGIGWEGYDNNKTVQANLDTLEYQYDMAIAYKPLEMLNFKDITIPKCIRYNEMFDAEWTYKEIVESGANLVICHHQNEMKFYQHIPNIKMVYIPHCANTSIFRKYKECSKNIDILLVGCIGERYPLRVRMAKILQKIHDEGKYTCKIHQHPGYNLSDAHTNKYLVDFAKDINQAKIAITCCGKYRSRYGKLVEIPMCGTALASDIPDDESRNFRNFVIELRPDMTDDEIIAKLEWHLENREHTERLIKRGLEWSSQYSQEYYANQLLNNIYSYLDRDRYCEPIIQSLWIGPTLSNLEILSMKSFLFHNHIYHLYTYNEIDNVPEGVVIRDAREILPETEIFSYANGSVSAFSNMFRYKMLFDKGGYWVDADVVCMKRFDFKEPYIIATEPKGNYNVSTLNPSLIKAPVKSFGMFAGYKFCQDKKEDVLNGKIQWNLGPVSFSFLTKESNLLQYARPWNVFNSHQSADWYSILMNPTRLYREYKDKIGKEFNKLAILDINKKHKENYAIHLYNEMWRSKGCDKNDVYEEGCLYEQLKKLYGVKNKEGKEPRLLQIFGEKEDKILIF